MSSAAPAPTIRGRARDAAILEAARAVFLEHGFEAATLDLVIGRSGGSRATLYQRFGGKAGLFAAIIRDLRDKIVAPLGTAADGERSNPAEVLVGFGRRFMSILMTDESLALYRLVIGETRHFPELGQLVFEAGPAAAAERLSDYLRRATQQGRLAVADPDLAARQFLEMVKGDLHTRTLFGAGRRPSSREIDDCVRGAVATFLYGAATRRRARRRSAPRTGIRS